MAVIANRCMVMAKSLVNQNNDELVELSVKSTDYNHRVAAAWYFGIKKEPTDCLIKLLEDRHPLVSLAAHESCVSIAKTQQKELVDFGPFGKEADKKASAELWSAYFEKKEKSLGRAKTPAEILGLESDKEAKK
jgi:hypothetical protein